MAGSEVDGLSAEMETVARTIKDFSDGRVDEALGTSMEAISFSVSKKMGIPLILSKQLAQLESDVDELKRNILKKKNHLRKVKSWIREEEEMDEPKSTEEARRNVENLENMILQMHKLTGVVFEDFQEEVLKKDDRFTQKHYNIKGTCNDIEFSVEFNIEEILLENGQSEVDIKEFLAYVPQDVWSELEKPLERVVNDQNVQGFFRLIIPYTKWKHHRQNLLHHFAEKYPDFVTVYVRDTDCVLMVISPPESKHGPILTISFEFSSQPLDRVVPKIKLGVEVSKEILKLDAAKVLENAPDNFEDLVEEFGVERAIDIMIRLVQQQTNI